MATSRQSERLVEAGGEDASDARVVSARMGETVGGVLYCAMPECRTWRPLAEFHGVRREARPLGGTDGPLHGCRRSRGPRTFQRFHAVLNVMKAERRADARTGGGATTG